MVKVITYGTYDMLHQGHIRLLERAKALGEYLIVGVTADDFDKTRGKINVQQSLMERIENVRTTGLADEIIVEEYEGQKIDDIRKYDVDIFTVGSDWIGKFDYLNEYCKVVYLERTEGVSSTEIREQKRSLRLGIIGESQYLCKVVRECSFVNGIKVQGLFSDSIDKIPNELKMLPIVTDDFDKFLQEVDAVYVRSFPTKHFEHTRQALLKGKHVLCESPLTMSKQQCKELFELAQQKKCILMEAIKTAYNTAFSRLVLLAKGGRIGDIVSIDATCTSLRNLNKDELSSYTIWNSICDWGPTAMLPIFEILGVEYRKKHIYTHLVDSEKKFDDFTKIDFLYDKSVASIKVGIGVKSEGELIISGTKGYIYVPAPWWKTDYFEIRYENFSNNRRYFYQLEGEGIRYELVAFVRAIDNGKIIRYINKNVSKTIASVIDDFYMNIDVTEI
ncbi:Gfo/Idh/MocA family oxidoreductase [Eisenbergiella massiliensis]|uniref:Glycerol-3-phosphate cytidylyltransferase n=1 Tax=Eisenbergiella massiliensis TaxID=1720294 RepID=A0A3E3I0M3_9FIRM|nr:Gfo/Idh/MocA family oxidoreductase [Eisenbergiella massiliensis]RGE57771.1 glycerol-3-phosphate cytidylyltransferase [Eisenbergiella massiliensis]